MTGMPVHRESTPHYDVTLGPCPGCLSWQVDYTYQAAGSYFMRVPVESPEFVDRGTGFHEVLEQVLIEHMAECEGLREIVEGT